MSPTELERLATIEQKLNDVVDTSLERQTNIESKLDGLKTLIEQRLETVERTQRSVWWVLGVVGVALMGGFIGHILSG